MEKIDPAKQYSFMIKLLQVLENGNESISEALTLIRHFFHLACISIYEADHSSVFHRKESVFASYVSIPLPEKVNSISFFSDCSEVLLVPVTDPDGQVSCFIAASKEMMSSDDSEALTHSLLLVGNFLKIRQYMTRLQYSQSSLESTLDHSSTGLYVNDFDTYEILYTNKTMAEPYGGAEKLIGQKCFKALYPDQDEPCSYCPRPHLIDEEGNPSKAYVWDYQRPFDGAWFHVVSAAFPWVDGRLAQVISSIDITEKKKNQLLVEQMAYFDTLTGVANRRKFESDFKALLAANTGKEMSGALLFVDLDNFKHINDTFGHDVGDRQLVEIASYLNGLPSCRDHVYRFGGDEFIVLLDAHVRDSVEKISNEILERCKKPWHLDNELYYCTVSLGIALYPQDGVTYNQLLSSADSAMYTAKGAGKAKIAFFTGYGSAENVNLELEFALRKTVSQNCNEFSPAFLPIISAQTHSAVGYEVLLRWKSPAYGLLFPQDFLAIAQELGLIVPIGQWLLRESIQKICQSKAFLEKKLYISFNLSKEEFSDDGFEPYLNALVDEFSLPASLVMLEISESATGIPAVRSKIERLRQNGFLISIDGFGLNYTSTNVANLIPTDMVKIDKGFVLNCLESRFSRTLVKTIAMLAHAAGTQICAEGVENAEIAAYLVKSGYDYLQGEYFSDLSTIMPIPSA